VGLIYVASSWRNPWQPAVVHLLRGWGFAVYDFRNPKPGDHGFHWRGIDPDWRDWSPERYRHGLTHPIAEAGFKLDMDALRASDACVLVQPCGTSAHLELGWAAGAGKRTAVFFPMDLDTRGSLGHSMDARVCGACPVDVHGNYGDCLMPGKLRRIEPELMAKAADAILINTDELRGWLNKGQELLELERTPDGHINNCALANHDEERNCQMCPGACPDRARFRERGVLR
jgi:hypothetical protein